MATRVDVTTTCDISGMTAGDTVRFGLDGVSYDIDLCPEQARELRGILSPYAKVARKVTARVERTELPGEVREWARNNGYSVGERGRIPDSVKVLFRLARDYSRKSVAS